MSRGACKLCVVGMPGVGKTSLVQRLCFDRFPALPPAAGITVVAHAMRIEERPLPVTLWDVAGASLIDNFNQAFLSRIDGVAAVVDACDDRAIDEALQIIFPPIRALYPATAAVLLINKRDLEAGAARVMPALPADVAGFAVSALDGQGVVAAFTALAATCRASATFLPALESGLPMRAQ